MVRSAIFAGPFPITHLPDHRDSTAAVATNENEFLGGRMETAPTSNSGERITGDCPEQVALSVENLRTPRLLHAPAQENVPCGMPAGHERTQPSTSLVVVRYAPGGFDRPFELVGVLHQVQPVGEGTGQE